MAAAAQGVSQRGSAASRVTLWLCICGALLASAGASAERPQRVGEPPREEALGTAHGRVTISPSASASRVFRNDAQTGEVEVRAATLDFLLRVAYSVHPRDIVYEAQLDRQARYDVVAKPRDRTRETALRLIRDQLEIRFGFEASRESRLVAVRILRRLAGGFSLQESTADEKEVVGGHGRFVGTRASMSDLARFTRTLTPEPVVDETGLEGNYDVVMEWDASAGSHAFLQAFADLGLELVDGERRVEHLIIRRPAHPKSRSAPPKSSRPKSSAPKSDRAATPTQPALATASSGG